MPSKKEHLPSTDDPALLTSQNLLVTAEATSSDNIVNLAERGDHLVAALSYYDTAQLHAGYLNMLESREWRRQQEYRYGKSRVLDTELSKKRQYEESLNLAKGEFRSAYGVSSMVESGSATAEDAEAEMNAQYQDFESQYLGSTITRRAKRSQQKRLYQQHAAGLFALEGVVEGPVTPEPARKATSAADKKFLYDPKAKVNLSTALRPEFFGVIKEDYEVTDPVWDRAVHPAKLKIALVDTPERLRGFSVKNRVQYPDEQDPRKWHSVVFAPNQWSQVLRSGPERWGSKGYNLSEVLQHAMPIEEADQDAPRRAANHAAVTAIRKMNSLSQNQLLPHLELINRFQEASRFQGNLLRFGSQQNMLEQMSYLWDTVVGDMLWTVRLSNNGSFEDEPKARQALEKAVFAPEEPAERLKRFGAVLHLGREWIEAQQQYLQWKQHEVERFLDENETDEEKRARVAQLQQSA